MSMEQYAMYLRKSRADLELEAIGEGETLAKHRRILYALAERYDIPPSAITVYQEIVSGESIQDRPEVQRLLADIYARKYAGVLVVEVERLARGNTKDQGEIGEAFQISDTKIITPAKIYNPNNPFDQEYFEFGLFMSRREYNTIRRRLIAGREISVEDGNYIGSRRIFGYDIVRKSKKDRTLVPNEESKIVQMIFNWFTEDGETAGQIARRLTAMGIPTTAGNQEWTRATVLHTLSNSHYLGFVRWNVRKVAKVVKDGKLVRRVEKTGTEILHKGKHEQLISQEQFDKAQKIIAERKAPPVNNSHKLKNPLAGLLFCKDCGCAISYYNPAGTPAAKYDYSPRYTHPSKVLCKKKSMPYADVIAALIHSLRESIRDTEMMIENEKDDDGQRQEILNAMRDNLSKHEQRKNRLLLSWESGDGIYTREEYIQRKRMYDDTIEDLKRQIEETENALPKNENYRDRLVRLSALVDTIESDDVQPAEINRFIKESIRRIDYDVIDYGAKKGGKVLLDLEIK